MRPDRQLVKHGSRARETLPTPRGKRCVGAAIAFCSAASRAHALRTPQLRCGWDARLRPKSASGQGRALALVGRSNASSLCRAAFRRNAPAQLRGGVLFPLAGWEGEREDGSVSSIGWCPRPAPNRFSL
jgi:hypothetical protein